MKTRGLALGATVALIALAGWWVWWPRGDHLEMGDMAMGDMRHEGGGNLPRAMRSTFMSGIADGSPIVAPRLPEDMSAQAQAGKAVFEAKCASCHGANAAGIKGAAPPLVHKIYEPSHHGDYAFQLAVQQGVRAHHWPFGDMAPVPGVTPAQVQDIVAYVRGLQRANGIE